MNAHFALPVLGTAALLLLGSAPAEPEVSKVCLEQQKYFQSLDSLRFQASMTMEMSQEYRDRMKAPAAKLDFSVDFASDRSKFYSRNTFTDWSTGEETTEVSAYNGERYQHLEKASGALTLSDAPILTNQYFGPNPITLPFLFAYDQSSTFTLTTLRDPQRWEGMAETATYVGSETTDGHRCDVIEFPIQRDGQTGRARVWFARDLGGFPVRSAIRDGRGHPVGECTVTGPPRATAWSSPCR